jgi:hypothetical protein
MLAVVILCSWQQRSVLGLDVIFGNFREWNKTENETKNLLKLRNKLKNETFL